MVEKRSQGSSRIGPKADKDLTNAEKIIFGLKERGLTVASAESVTAGGFGYALTRVPGSSRVFKGGVAVYTRAAKKQFLNISDALMDRGLVTPEITLEMAHKVLELLDVDYGVACTGNAGPTTEEGSAGVGRIYWAIVDSKGREEVAECDHFGNRDAVRSKTITAGLRLLRNFIERSES